MSQARHLLPYLYSFSIVARLRSFTLAAEELSISQSGVSYQIKKLEDQLGYPLLIREPRRPIQLTSKGKILLQLCEEMYANLENTLEEMSGSSLSGELSLTADVCFGTMVVSPALNFIQQRYPHLSFRLNLCEEFIHLANNEIELAIRSRTGEPGMAYEPLCKTNMLLVASKPYLQSTPPIRRFEDLKHHRILCTGEDDFDWHELIANIGELDWQSLHKRSMINNLQALTQAMSEGSGVCYVAAFTVAKQLEEGSIEIVLPDQLPQMEISYYLAYPSHTKSAAKIQAFSERLKTYIQHSALSSFFTTTADF
ncbi:LysR family transcriptional regulator [Pontibacterium granulatum]|uniref:LysR family transcriptional regulator n=1 Tax=Pontibacterium granulatum TaxID=2036029 RepID=UPI00249C1E4B|nr:LysR family transcriptional regulator [Pontibacterium granulatum]MDI3324856.1 LysR family transcriptional regulator [Pontibacterium granulatum]